MNTHWAEVLVLDCSQVATPEEFWEAYVQELPAENAVYFGKNLDALWDALSAGGPGFPDAASVELRNLERLSKYEDGAFVQALRKIADELAESCAAVSLRIVAHGPPPRGRLYQHEKLRSRELAESRIERAMRWAPHAGTCEILWLKPEGMCWQKLFLDAGLAFWEEWEDSAFEEQASELEPAPEFVGASVMLLAFESSGGLPTEIRFELSTGLVARLHNVDAGASRSGGLRAEESCRGAPRPDSGNSSATCRAEMPGRDNRTRLGYRLPERCRLASGRTGMRTCISTSLVVAAILAACAAPEAQESGRYEDLEPAEQALAAAETGARRRSAHRRAPVWDATRGHARPRPLLGRRHTEGSLQA